MKMQYEISINHNDLFKNECLSQILNNLEKLDQITEDVFNRINKNIMEKKTKLENLKSRINRAGVIIANLETLPQALTIKSKRFYPSNDTLSNQSEGEGLSPINGIINNSSNNYNTFNNIFPRSIYYDDVCDFNLLKNNPVAPNANNEINSKPSNPPNKLGKKPDASLDEVSLSQELLNSIQGINHIKSDLSISRCANNLFNKNEIGSEIRLCNSIFGFMDKSKIFGQKLQQAHTEQRQSTLLNSFMRKKNVKKILKKPQEAPVSISEKLKMTQFKQKKELIRRNTNNNLQLNIPTNINLPLISDFYIETTPLEDYFAEDKEEVYAPQGTIFSDDVTDDFQTPLDIIKNYKKKQSMLLVNSDQIVTQQTTPTVPNKNINNNSNTATNTMGNTSNTQYNVAYTSNTQSNVANTSNTQSDVANTTVKPVNSVSSTSTSAITNTNSTIPKVPSAIPPVPKIPAVPVKKIVSNEKNSSPKIQEEKKDVKPVPVTLNIYEEIGENPMARLKKIGSVYVNDGKTGESKKSDETKKKEPPTQASMVLYILF